MLSQRQLFLNNVAQTSPAPLALEIKEASGIYLIDKEGKSYIDLIAGIAVSNLGHNHPSIIKAIKKQADHYLHTLVYGEFVLSPQVSLAELLCSVLPKSLNSVYYTNSGAEATEGALKLAKRYTGRYNIIACRNSYHGSTHGAMSLMSDSYFTSAYRPLLPNISHIDFNNEQELFKIDHHTACVIMETIRAEVGVELPQNDYLQKVRQRCNEVGALLILDEIQVGCGRTGSLFAFEQYGIIPDILLLAKGFGGGMPLGAFVANKEVMQVFTENPVLGHITTFGGHPVSCAAALASLKILTEQKEIIAGVAAKADLFIKLLKHPKILGLRNAGLLMAIQLASFEEVQTVITNCIENGLITDWFLFNDSAVRIAPPLIISMEEIEKACTILLKALDTL